MIYDVITLGECLIDFTPHGVSEMGRPLYEQNPGGAPVNVAAALSKLGKRTAFLGKVGTDPLGDYLKEALQTEGISIEGMTSTSDAHTTMAFVHLDENGDRSFHFCRHPGADQLLEYQDVDLSMLENTILFHFGSISMTSEPAYSATLQTVRKAKELGAIISYDPNWRPSLWKNERHAIDTIQAGLGMADIVKVSEDELAFLTKFNEAEQGAAELMKKYPIQLLLITAGSNGAYYRTDEYWGKVETFPVQTVDTTGAGDGFLGALLFRILERGKPIEQWKNGELREAVLFANAAGALAATRKGAIPSFAGLQEINKLLSASSGTEGVSYL